MKRFVNIMAVALVMLLCAAPALAAGQISVVQQAETIVENDDNCKVTVYAELKNNGASAERLTDMLLEITDADGKVLASTESYKCYPEILQPGETGYLVASKKVEDISSADAIAACSLILTSSGDVKDELVRFAAQAEVRPDEDEDSDKQYAYITFENTDGDTLYDFVLAYALKDADGKLLYVSGLKSGSFGLLPGSAIEAKDRIKQNVLDDIEDSGAKIASAEAVVYTVLDDED